MLNYYFAPDEMPLLLPPKIIRKVSKRRRVISIVFSVIIIVALFSLGFFLNGLNARTTLAKFSALNFNATKVITPPPEPAVENQAPPNSSGETRPVVPDGSKTIYLTFDDGPSANVPELLGVLDFYGVKATFFVIGNSHHEYYKTILDHGDALGLHTYSHNYATVYASDAAFFADLERDSDAVFAATGTRPTIIRFPGGSSNTVSANYSSGIMSRLTAEVEARGYRYFDWNCSAGDANGGVASVAAIVASATGCYGNSIMLLAHDRVGNTVAAMKEIIPIYKARGYEFKVVEPTSLGFHHRVAN
jgi:peptidoglycan/xylan/chitin deacetylase (PgdA/CDA1 family)